MAADLAMNGPEESAHTQIMDTFKLLAPLLDHTLKLSENPKDSKQPRKASWARVEQTDPGQVEDPPAMVLLRLMGQLILRHERNWNLLQSTDCFILFFQQEQGESFRNSSWKRRSGTKTNNKHRPHRCRYDNTSAFGCGRIS